MTAWREDCPARAVALSHAHWRECDPSKGGHPPDPGFPLSGQVIHQWTQCCHCGINLETEVESAMQRDMSMREAGIPPEADDPPLSLDQDCNPSLHAQLSTKTPKIGDDGWEWPTCHRCEVQVEPKLATGEPVGPSDAPSRGWVSPRLRAKWEAIAFRLRGLHG